ncbi:nascent polypeptide-associated complex subunit beta [Pyrenophora seminiperda CCB06]|uniref:Nascent polypeptide-associated complex subunit beta n=1 Tax=Pyrenophora seminiperda CCB06 TaxID=1302712 RepID=A0A3M7MII0_9PLEO|nr:nascent polypeptide-associated complex subunit beta [Pyrenophora seminiperda CCB06]
MFFMLSNSLLALSFLPLTFAHFQLKYPTARGFDDDKEGNFPCGGFDDIQSKRTNFSISGGPIQLEMGHPQTNLAVYMAIGDNPGSGFSVVAKHQLSVDGLGNFCLGSVAVPSDVKVADGTKASIQVVTNSDESGGGLYQCADVVLVDNKLSQSDFSTNCQNNTGIKVSQENISGNPNGTSTGSSPSTSSSGVAASPKPTGAAGQVKVVSWMLGAAGVAKLARMQASVRIAPHHHIEISELPPQPAIARNASRRNFGYMEYLRLIGDIAERVKKVHRNAGTDDKKLQTALKKLNVQPIQAIEEVNMFKSDGNVIHFSAPKVHASVPANTFAIYGHGEDKELTELVPGILNQLGPDSLASLRKLAESYQSMQKEKGEDGDKKDDDDEDDDDIPELVAGENFESKGEVE